MYSRTHLSPLPDAGLPPFQKPAKLTGQQRDEIREKRLAGVDPKVLSLEYGVTAGYIRHMFSPA